MKGIGSLFKGLGEAALKRLKYLWRGSGDIAKTLKGSQLEDIPNAVHKMKLFRSRANDALESGYAKGRDIMRREYQTRAAETKRLYDELGRRQRGLQKLRRELRTLENNADYYERLAATTAREDYANMYAAKAMDAKQRVGGVKADLIEYIEDLKGLRGTYNNHLLEKQIMGNLYSGVKKDPQGVISTIKQNTEIQGRFPSLGSWVDEIEGAALNKERIFKSVSKNLGSDVAFSKEYLKNIHPFLDGGDEYAKNWMANPQNASKLMELVRTKKLGKYLNIGAGPEAARAALKGLTRRELAKKLGISVAATAAILGPLQFMGWFDESSKAVTARSNDLSESLKSFRASGEGNRIVAETIQAIQNIEHSSKVVQRGMSINPERAGQRYVNDIITNKAIIDKNLQRWDVVIDSADDKEAAQHAKQVLSVYSKTLAKNLNEVNTIAQGRPGGIAGDRPQPRGKISREHIKGIQNYLRNRQGRSFQSVAPTGNLDKPTVSSLRSLEKEYDSISDSNRFSGKRLLVRPNEGHLIELEDLIKLDKVMNKYTK